MLEVEQRQEAAEIPPWTNLQNARSGDRVEELGYPVLPGYPKGRFRKRERVIEHIDSVLVQTMGPCQPGTSGGVLECAHHPHFYCFALISEDVKVAGRAIPYEVIADYLEELKLELPTQPISRRAAVVCDIAKYRERVSEALGLIDLGGLQNAERYVLLKIRAPSHARAIPGPARLDAGARPGGVVAYLRKNRRRHI